MARLNTRQSSNPVFTHEGAPAYGHMTPMQALRRSVLSCLLWEDEFYEDGQAIANRISELAIKVPFIELAALCVEARGKYNLRHVPLLLLLTMIKASHGSSVVSETIAATIQRADEMAELLALYWKNRKPGDRKRPPLSAQLKKGLAKAFTKFDAYQLAKYNRDDAIKLRDVMFLVCPKPKDEAQAAVFKKLAENQLESPDTWEVALSSGANKKETFERLIREGNLGYLALLRNLRNMIQAGCDMNLVQEAILARKNGAQRVLPFRYVAAARACPQLEPAIDQALSEAISELPVLEGKTIVLVDVSASMNDRLSSKSDMTRMDAGAALAAIIHGDIRMFSFSNDTVEVPPRRGMAGVDAIKGSQTHSGTYLGEAVSHVNRLAYDRLIVITDEQSHDRVPVPNGKKAYIINVASNQNGVGYGPWVHIDGFSEHVLRFITEYESQATR